MIGFRKDTYRQQYFLNSLFFFFLLFSFLPFLFPFVFLFSFLPFLFFLLFFLFFFFIFLFYFLFYFFIFLFCFIYFIYLFFLCDSLYNKNDSGRIRTYASGGEVISSHTPWTTRPHCLTNVDKNGKYIM